MIITQRGQLLLSRACFWSGPLIDSHFVLILVSGNDPHIWTAEFIERSLRNDIKTTNCTGKHVQPRLTREDSLLYPPLSLSVFRSDDHLPSLPSFYVYVLPLFCNQFSFALCLRPSFLRVSNSLSPFPHSAFSHSSVISLPSFPLWFCSIPTEVSKVSTSLLLLVLCFSLFNIKVTTREQPVLLWTSFFFFFFFRRVYVFLCSW